MQRILFSLRYSLIATAIFALVGFAAAVALFWQAPRIWEGSIVAGLAAGTGGFLGWTALCAGWAKPAWWRSLLAGVVAGIAVHPLYFFFLCALQRNWMAPSDFLIGSMFSLLVAGVITIPAGVVSAAISHVVSGRLFPTRADHIGPQQRNST